MATKKKKAKNSSRNKGYYSHNHFWLQLPQQINQSLSKNRKRNALRYVNSSTGVTKTWVPNTSRCGLERPPPPLLRRVDESAYLKYFPGDCPFTAERVARIDSDISFLGFNQYERSLADPFRIRRDPLFQNYMDFSGMLSFEGKMYALSLQGALVVVETIDSRPTITVAASNRAVPSLSWRFFKEYLVEIGGEILMILLIHQESLGIVDFVQVFRLCLRRVKWIKAEGIGGNVVFLDPRFVWGNSEEIGCKGDCIYFTQASSSGWLVYHMETALISHAHD